MFARTSCAGLTRTNRKHPQASWQPCSTISCITPPAASLSPGGHSGLSRCLRRPGLAVAPVSAAPGPCRSAAGPRRTEQSLRCSIGVLGSQLAGDGGFKGLAAPKRLKPGHGHTATTRFGRLAGMNRQPLPGTLAGAETELGPSEWGGSANRGGRSGNSPQLQSRRSRGDKLGCVHLGSGWEERKKLCNP